MDNNELQHWGIKGQKWGLRRFQNPDGSLTAAGRKRYGEEKDEPKKETSKPKTKEEVLKSGSARELMELKGNLTNKEYEDVFRRLDYEKKMSAYSESETKTGLDKLSDIMTKVDHIRANSQKAIDAYNVVAKVNNAFNPSFRLPPIDGSINRALKSVEDASDAAKKAIADARKDAKTADKLDKIEKDVAKKGDKALDGLTTNEIKELNARTANKKAVANTLKDKKVDEPEAKPKTETETKPTAAENSSKTETSKVDNVISKLSDKKVDVDPDTLPTLYVSDSYSKVKLSSLTGKTTSKKANSSESASKTRERTAKAVSAWYKAGHSVAEIAKKYGMSESAIYKMIEELQ